MCVCGKLTTCHDALKQLFKSKEYKAITRKKDKHLDKYYKRNDEESWNYINDFLKDFNIILDNCKEKIDISEEDINKFNDLYI